MRQLKGRVKETPAQKKERKKDFRENRENVMKIAVPALVVLGLIVFVVVYLGTSRPTSF